MFWRTSPTTWFIHIESKFDVNGITGDEMQPLANQGRKTSWKKKLNGNPSKCIQIPAFWRTSSTTWFIWVQIWQMESQMTSWNSTTSSQTRSGMSMNPNKAWNLALPGTQCPHHNFCNVLETQQIWQISGICKFQLFYSNLWYHGHVLTFSV